MNMYLYLYMHRYMYMYLYMGIYMEMGMDMDIVMPCHYMSGHATPCNFMPSHVIMPRNCFLSRPSILGASLVGTPWDDVARS